MEFAATAHHAGTGRGRRLWHCWQGADDSAGRPRPAGVAPLHELGRPFSEAEGPGLLAGLRFDADNTLADTPMVGLLSALGSLLDDARARAASGSRMFGSPFSMEVSFSVM